MIDLTVRGESYCKNWADLPKDLEAAVGGLVEEAILICGGTAHGQSFDECYTLSQERATFVTNMTAKREYAASIVLYQTMMWVSGGWSSDTGSLLSSSEFITIEGTKLGPSMPMATSSHVKVAISNTLTMLIGGETKDGPVESTFYYDHRGQIWTDGPNLIQARRWHAAGVVTDEVTKEKLVIVSGGDFYGTKLDTSEILLNNIWNSGKRAQSFYPMTKLDMLRAVYRI